MSEWTGLRGLTSGGAVSSSARWRYRYACVRPCVVSTEKGYLQRFGEASIFAIHSKADAAQSRERYPAQPKIVYSQICTTGTEIERGRFLCNCYLEESLQAPPALSVTRSAPPRRGACPRALGSSPRSAPPRLPRPTVNANSNATGGLPDHQTPIDPHFYTMNPKNLSECYKNLSWPRDPCRGWRR